MKPLKTFTEYLELGIARKITPDINRSKALVLEAHNRKEFLEQLKQIPIQQKNANYFIENCYDLLMALVRATMLSKGFHASGEGAHEAEIAFLQHLNFPQGDILFLNELRHFRNGILYYGKQLDEQYAQKVLAFTNNNYLRLQTAAQHQYSH